MLCNILMHPPPQKKNTHTHTNTSLMVNSLHSPLYALLATTDLPPLPLKTMLSPKILYPYPTPRRMTGPLITYTPSIRI